MIKVLIVDDSMVVRELYNHILSSDPEIQIIGAVKNGKDAIEFINRNKPDIVTMDINMPVMGGIEAIKTIMATNPLPIIVVSNDFNQNSINDSFEAIEAGALAVIEKPNIQSNVYDEVSKNFISSIKLMSEIKVIKRRFNKAIISNDRDTYVKDKIEKVNEKLNNLSSNKKFEIIAIGVSTGGPPVLQKIFSSLSEDFSIPILVVQHITDGFLQGFVEWLNLNSKIKVIIAENNQLIEKGYIYFAPNNKQMGVNKNNRIILTNEPVINNIRPSVSYLFKSILDIYKEKSIAIILTGMGKDGAEELLKLRNAGAITIAQDKESSAVFGMPGEAVRINAAKHVLSPEEISEKLIAYEHMKI